MFEFRVDETASGQRLDVFLTHRLPQISRSKIKSAIGISGARVNGDIEKPSYRVRTGDCIQLNLQAAPESPESMPEDLPLTVWYEDEALAVVEKPAGMVVHVGAGVHSGTLVNALRFHLKSLSAPAEPVRPGIVHRLDKLTSGLMVVAKSDAAHAALADQFRSRSVQKRYVALVHGRLARPRGEIALPIARDRLHRTRMTTRAASGREALTRYRISREFEKYTLLDVEIKTGRTHQIRVHFSSLGHPVVGDRTYGAPAKIWIPGNSQQVPTLSRHFLHAAYLSFDHPGSGQRMNFHSPLPEELDQFLHACEGQTPSARLTVQNANDYNRRSHGVTGSRSERAEKE
ncbi:MAG: RluA family pseudouridine synthase [Acidobacteriia bacterium]|nr:RluA family pseudouridine synthase [Terriglobia bacterium]